MYYYNKYTASPLHKAWILDEIGLHFDILNNYDSAMYYYKKGEEILFDTNSSTYRDIATHLAFLSYKRGDSVTAINHLYKIKKQAESEHEYTSRCLTIGEIYYHEHRLDSAWHYLSIVYKKIIVLVQKSRRQNGWQRLRKHKVEMQKSMIMRVFWSLLLT